MPIEAGGRTMVTWLTPYWDLYTAHIGAISGGRLAKALAPVRQVLGDEGALRAFECYCVTPGGIKRVEYFASECRKWLQKSDQGTLPLVSETGTLTDAGRRAYEGRA